MQETQNKGRITLDTVIPEYTDLGNNAVLVNPQGFHCDQVASFLKAITEASQELNIDYHDGRKYVLLVTANVIPTTGERFESKYPAVKGLTGTGGATGTVEIPGWKGAEATPL